MLHRILPRRVVVSLGVSFALVGFIVVAGALLRHHDSTPPTPGSPRSTVTSAARGAGAR